MNNQAKLTLLMVCAILGHGARAQAQQEQNILRGPAVPDSAQRTLIHEGMRSGFQRIEGRPEVAAVDLLDLSPEIKRQIESLVREHEMGIAMLLVERIDDIKVISDAVLAGDRQKAEELMRKLWKVYDTDRSRSPLLASFGKVLKPSELNEVRRLSDEYWEAWIQSQMPSRINEMDQAQLKEAHDRVELRLSFQLFQEEVQRGYELTLRRYRDAMNGIYAAVDPTDEQRHALRAILIEHIRTTKLEPTQAQRRQAYVKMYRALDEPRKEKLFEYLLAQVIPGE